MGGFEAVYEGSSSGGYEHWRGRRGGRLSGDEERKRRGIYTEDEITEYATAKNIVPGTILWGAGIELTEDAFRVGGKNNAAVDFLRWKDLGYEDKQGRLADGDLDREVIEPGEEISMFIKKFIAERRVWLGPGPVTRSQEKSFKQDYAGVGESYWWQVDKGQVIPVGLQLRFDGVPPGHCTLTVDRSMTVRAYLSLVSMIRFSPKGSDLFGSPK